MDGSKKRKVNIPMCAAFILFVLTLISMHLTSGLYARYTVTGSGSDSARVAKFDVVVAPSENQTGANVDCAEETVGSYSFTVTNRSEVAVRYSVKVKFTKKYPATLLEVQLDGGYPSIITEDEMTFLGAGELAPLVGTAEHTLYFRVTKRELFGGDEAKENVELPVDFTVTVHAEQID